MQEMLRLLFLPRQYSDIQHHFGKPAWLVLVHGSLHSPSDCVFATRHPNIIINNKLYKYDIVHFFSESSVFHHSFYSALAPACAYLRA